MVNADGMVMGRPYQGSQFRPITVLPLGIFAHWLGFA